MKKISLIATGLIAATLLFTACKKDQQTVLPTQKYLELINGTWYTAASGADINTNGTPDPEELTPIDSAVQKIYTVFLGNGKAKAYGTFMGMELDTTEGTWLITPDRFLETNSPSAGPRRYYIYELNDSLMILKSTDTYPNRWISYDRQ